MATTFRLWVCTCLLTLLLICSSTVATPCSPDPCHNGANCTVVGESFACDCLPGWTGTTCAEDFDDCASSPCPAGALCTDQFQGFTCSCQSDVRFRLQEDQPYVRICSLPCGVGSVVNGGGRHNALSLAGSPVLLEWDSGLLAGTDVWIGFYAHGTNTSLASEQVPNNGTWHWTATDFGMGSGALLYFGVSGVSAMDPAVRIGDTSAPFRVASSAEVTDGQLTSPSDSADMKGNAQVVGAVGEETFWPMLPEASDPIRVHSVLPVPTWMESWLFAHRLRVDMLDLWVNETALSQLNATHTFANFSVTVGFQAAQVLDSRVRAASGGGGGGFGFGGGGVSVAGYSEGDHLAVEGGVSVLYGPSDVTAADVITMLDAHSNSTLHAQGLRVWRFNISDNPLHLTTNAQHFWMEVASGPAVQTTVPGTVTSYPFPLRRDVSGRFLSCQTAVDAAECVASSQHTFSVDLHGEFLPAHTLGTGGLSLGGGTCFSDATDSADPVHATERYHTAVWQQLSGAADSSADCEDSTLPQCRYDSSVDWVPATTPGLTNDNQGFDTAFMFGGRSSSFDVDTIYNDLWGYSVLSGWQLITASSCVAGNADPPTQPPCRYLHSLVRIGRYLYLFGGRDTSQTFSDLWRVDASDLTNPTFARLSDGSDVRPVYGHAVATDGVDKMFVFGGAQVSELHADAHSNQVLQYDVSGGGWSVLYPQTGMYTGVMTFGCVLNPAQWMHTPPCLSLHQMLYYEDALWSFGGSDMFERASVDNVDGGFTSTNAMYRLNLTAAAGAEPVPGALAGNGFQVISPGDCHRTDSPACRQSFVMSLQNGHDMVVSGGLAVIGDTLLAVSNDLWRLDLRRVTTLDDTLRQQLAAQDAMAVSDADTLLSVSRVVSPFAWRPPQSAPILSLIAALPDETEQPENTELSRGLWTAQARVSVSWDVAFSQQAQLKQLTDTLAEAEAAVVTRLCGDIGPWCSTSAVSSSLSGLMHGMFAGESIYPGSFVSLNQFWAHRRLPYLFAFNENATVAPSSGSVYGSRGFSLERHFDQGIPTGGGVNITLRGFDFGVADEVEVRLSSWFTLTNPTEYPGQTVSFDDSALVGGTGDASTTTFGVSDTVVESTDTLSCVAFGGAWDSDQWCVVTVPPGAGKNVSLSLVRQAGAEWPALQSIYFSHEPPVITGLAYDHRFTEPEAFLYIYGRNFGPPGSQQVHLFRDASEGANSECNSLLHVNDTHITCAMPQNSAFGVRVAVQVGGQWSNASDPTTFTDPAPVIDAVYFPGGPIATDQAHEIVIVGQYLASGPGQATVYVGSQDVSGSYVQWVNHTRLVVTVPPTGSGGQDLNVTVAVGMQSTQAPAGYTFSFDPPTITQALWSTQSALTEGNNVLTIKGTNFGQPIAGVQSVEAFVGDSACFSTVHLSHSVVHCYVPEGVGSAAVTVTVAGVPMDISHPEVIYRYRAPEITDISPSTVIIGAASSYRLTITGTSLGTGVADDMLYVLVGGERCENAWFIDDHEIISCEPADVDTAGSLSVQVWVGYSGDRARSLGEWYVHYVHPQIHAVTVLGNQTADTEGGTQIMIEGSFLRDDFTSVSQAAAEAGVSVYVGGRRASNVQFLEMEDLSHYQTMGVVSGRARMRMSTFSLPAQDPFTPVNHTILCETPAGGGEDLEITVEVGVSAGTPAFPDGFSYAPPEITNVELPSGSSTGASTLVIVHGNNFGVDGTSTVEIKVGKFACTPVTFASETTLQCSLPSQSSGAGLDVDVIVDGQSALNSTVAANTSSFSVSFTPPLIQSVSPTSVLVDEAAQVTVTGLSFGDTTENIEVTIGGSPCAPVALILSHRAFTCTAKVQDTARVSPLVVTVSGQSSNSVSFEYEYPEASAGLTTFIYVLGVLGELYLGLLLLGVVYYRNNPHIRGASVPFCVIIVLGAMLWVGSVFLRGFWDDYICHMSYFMEAYGFTMVMASLALKNFRILKIFALVAKQKLQVKVINISSLIMSLMGLIALDTVLLSVLASQSRCGDPQDDPVANTMIGLTLAWKGILLFWAAVIAYRARVVTDPRFQERVQVAYAIYNCLVSAVIVVPIVVHFRTQYENIYGFRNAATVIVVLCTVSCLFFRKFYAIFSGEKAPVHAQSGSTVGGSSAGSSAADDSSAVSGVRGGRGRSRAKGQMPGRSAAGASSDAKKPAVEMTRMAPMHSQPKAKAAVPVSDSDDYSDSDSDEGKQPVAEATAAQSDDSEYSDDSDQPTTAKPQSSEDETGETDGTDGTESDDSDEKDAVGSGDVAIGMEEAEKAEESSDYSDSDESEQEHAAVVNAPTTMMDGESDSLYSDYSDGDENGNDGPVGDVESPLPSNNSAISARVTLHTARIEEARASHQAASALHDKAQDADHSDSDMETD